MFSKVINKCDMSDSAQKVIEKIQYDILNDAETMVSNFKKNKFLDLVSIEKTEKSKMLLEILLKQIPNPDYSVRPLNIVLLLSILFTERLYNNSSKCIPAILPDIKFLAENLYRFTMYSAVEGTPFPESYDIASDNFQKLNNDLINDIINKTPETINTISLVIHDLLYKMLFVSSPPESMESTDLIEQYYSQFSNRDTYYEKVIELDLVNIDYANDIMNIMVSYNYSYTDMLTGDNKIPMDLLLLYVVFTPIFYKTLIFPLNILHVIKFASENLYRLTIYNYISKDSLPIPYISEINELNEINDNFMNKTIWYNLLINSINGF